MYFKITINHYQRKQQCQYLKYRKVSTVFRKKKNNMISDYFRINVFF
jgi:hypothetical protein